MKYKKSLYLKFLILVIIAGIFTNVVLYQFYAQRELAVMRADAEARLAQTVYYVEKQLELMQTIGNVLWLNDDVQKLKSARPENSGYLQFRDIQDYINELVLSISSIQSVHIYFKQSKIIITSDDSVFYTLDKKLETYFENLMEISKEKKWFLGYPEYDFPYSHKKESAFSYICPIYSLDSNALSGVIAIQVRETMVANLLTDDESLNAFYMLDEFGNIVFEFKNNKISLSELEKQGLLEAIQTRHEGSREIDIQNKAAICAYYTSDYNGWTYISAYNATVPSIFDQLFWVYFLAIIAIYSLVFCLIVWISGREVGKPVDTLIHAMKQAQNGRFDYRIMTERTDEMGYIYQRFNHMMQHIQNLVDQVVEEQVMKKNAEYRLLQAQINPHFIFNIFNNMIWLLQQQNYAKLEDMLEATAGYYKTSLNYGNINIRVADVEAQLNCYATIQKIRFGDLFDYSIEFETEILEYTMPNLLIQPLLENAIGHGASAKEGTTFISVSGKRVSNCMEFKVLDDGIGIRADRLERIRQSIERKNCEGSDFFALSNIARRIAMYFGEEAKLTIESGYGMWTEVTLRIPIMESSQK